MRERRQEMGYRRWKTGDGRQEILETGDTGDRRLELGDRR